MKDVTMEIKYHTRENNRGSTINKQIQIYEYHSNKIKVKYKIRTKNEHRNTIQMTIKNTMKVKLNAMTINMKMK